MNTTSVRLLNIFRRFGAGLAGLALIGFAPLASAQPTRIANTQTAELEALLTAVHELTSYNGNLQTAADHLVAWEQLWAEDATLAVNGGSPIVGRGAIMNSFMNGPLFNNNWVGLTPSFRTKVTIHGDTAEVYLECIFLDATLAVKAQRSLWGTVRKIDGKWLFWRMANDPAQPLFP